MLTVKPMSLADANRFVAEHHRHHKPVRGHKFSLGCIANGHLAGVAIVGRPVSRYLDDGLTLEVNRLCTDGTKTLQLPLWRGGAGGEGPGLPIGSSPTFWTRRAASASVPPAGDARGWRADGSGPAAAARPNRLYPAADEIPI